MKPLGAAPGIPHRPSGPAEAEPDVTPGTPGPMSSRRRGGHNSTMILPIVTETTVRREPVVRDSFIDDLPSAIPRPGAR